MATNADEIEREIRESFPRTEGGMGATEFVVSEQFKESNNTPEGIRAPHAIEAARTAASVERYDLGGRFISIALARVGLGVPYTVVVLLDDAGGDRATIINAWRLYDVPADVAPARALALVVEQYGTEIEVDGRRGLFFGHVVLPAGQDSGVSIPDMARQTEIRANSFVRRRETGETDWSWCFAIDTRRYREHVRSRRR